MTQDAEASIRLIARVDPAFPNAFKIFTADDFLLAIGREPKRAAARRLLEERLATERSQVEPRVRGRPPLTVGDALG
jgi:hypothetical protein